MCGEQVELVEIQEEMLGSPPRVRGTAYGTETSDSLSGITPACAGNRLVVAGSDHAD